MKKVSLFLPLLFLIFQNAAMEHRRAMQDLREWRHTQQRDYKVPTRSYSAPKDVVHIEDDDVGDALVPVEHETHIVHSVGCSSGNWRKTMGMAMLCTLLVTAQAGCFHSDGYDQPVVCRHVTDSDLIGFAADYPFLTAISFNTDLNLISIKGLQILAEKCSYLRSIYLWTPELHRSDDDFCCAHLSVRDFEKFKQKYPHIQIYRNTPWEVEQHRKYKEREARVAQEKAERKAAEEKVRQDHEQRMCDILGDDRLA